MFKISLCDYLDVKMISLDKMCFLLLWFIRKGGNVIFSLDELLKRNLEGRISVWWKSYFLSFWEYGCGVLVIILKIVDKV